jgi:phospholipid/cholesterol/gamma-HCH transport system permease protein
MKSPPCPIAAIASPPSPPGVTVLVLSGPWNARGLGLLERQLDAITVPARTQVEADCAAVDALDTAGAWLLHKLLARLRGEGSSATLHGLRPAFESLLAMVEQQVAEQAQALAKKPAPPGPPPPSWLQGVGRSTVAVCEQSVALLAFVGESAAALVTCIRHPARLPWRPILFNIRLAGFDALPIVGLLSFLLGVVVAYQGAAQLRQYGANIFVADLVGVSMLREFAPLITAILIAGRSGSAYAAQIGTMAVTEEIDALRTLGIAPLELLVLPKVIALVIALPLLTVFADVMGVIGGMLMAQVQLDVGYVEFLDRFVKAVSPTTFLVGVGKAPVFAVIVAVVGCFQGFRTRGGADSVGRQTTRAVVQSMFLVIVADALFSIAFSALDL